jgi:biopolymer transport protein ExbB
MESQFGLVNVWTQGDWVTRSVALLLLGMSLASWIVILIKALDLRFKKLAQAAPSPSGTARLCRRPGQARADPSNPFRQLAVEGREATAHHRNTAQLHDSWT